MPNNDYLIISASDHDAIQDLTSWLSWEYNITSIKAEAEAYPTLGDKPDIRILFSLIKENVSKFLTLVKNWAYNYNKDIELVFENGDKKAMIKCPAKKVRDKDMELIFSSLSDFFD